MKNQIVATLVALCFAAISEFAIAQFPEGEITQVVAYVNGVPGTEFMPGDTIRVDAEGVASVPSSWGVAERISLLVNIENEVGVVEADSDVKEIAAGTGDDFEVDDAAYTVPGMGYATTYLGRVNLYYDAMGAVLLDDPQFVTFTTD